LDDYQLQRLFNSAPPRSILLLEDIDCAFGGEDDEEDNSKPNFVVLAGRSRAIRSGNGRVTFSGLLNCLDSVISGEGRFVFATVSLGSLEIGIGF
jgi:mitochondrial chaperone BCS1